MLPIFSYRGVSLPGTTPSGVLYDEFVQTADDTYWRPGISSASSGVGFGVAHSWDSGPSPSEVTGVRLRVGRGASAVVRELLRVGIYAHSGTYGTSSVPTGAALVQSDDFYALDEALDEGPSNFFFPLSGWTPDADTDYLVVADFFDQISSDATYASRFINEDGAQATHGGNVAYKTLTGAWIAVSADDLAFAVYMQSVASGSGWRSRSRSGRSRPGWF